MEVILDSNARLAQAMRGRKGLRIATPPCHLAVEKMSEFEESILRSLRRITRSIDLYSRQLASRHGLTGPQLVCLRTLARLGPSTPSVLARDMDLSQATVTGIVDRLEGQGLVGRMRNSSDRRSVTIGLTPKGVSVTASAPSALHDIFSGRLAALSKDEQAAIQSSLERIVEMMGAGDIGAEPTHATGADLLADAQILPLGGQLEANDRDPGSHSDPGEEEAK